MSELRKRKATATKKQRAIEDHKQEEEEEGGGGKVENDAEPEKTVDLTARKKKTSKALKKRSINKSDEAFDRLLSVARDELMGGFQDVVMTFVLLSLSAWYYELEGGKHSLPAGVFRQWFDLYLLLGLWTHVCVLDCIFHWFKGMRSPSTFIFWRLWRTDPKERTETFAGEMLLWVVSGVSSVAGVSVGYLIVLSLMNSINLMSKDPDLNYIVKNVIEIKVAAVEEEPLWFVGGFSVLVICGDLLVNDMTQFVLGSTWRNTAIFWVYKVSSHHALYMRYPFLTVGNSSYNALPIAYDPSAALFNVRVWLKIFVPIIAVLLYSFVKSKLNIGEKPLTSSAKAKKDQ